MTTSRWPVVVLLVAAFMACDDRSKRTEKQLADLKAKQDAQKAAAKEDKLAAPAELPKLDPPYDDSTSDRLIPDGACPEGLWALFPKDAPGNTPEEKKANAARRAEVAKSLEGKRFMVRLRAPNQVTLKPHDAVQGVLPIEVIGSVDCKDALGSVTVAWTDAKAGSPNASAAKASAEFVQNFWLAPPVAFTLPIKSMSEAKAFQQNNALGLTARVVFTFGKTEVDSKLRKVGKVSEKVEAAGETVGYGGGMEDWGAGRLVRANLVGLRVAVEQEKKQLYELKGPGY
jgi:hypothetical protein